MALEPVKIPQNVYIEDRIVGPLTLRQTMIMALGGGMSYGIYIALSKANGGHLGVVGTVLAWIPCGIAVIFALIRINDLSLFRMVLLLIERINKPSKRLWTPRRGLAIHIHTGNAAIQEKTAQQLAAEKQAQQSQEHTETKIQELSTLLDRPITPIERETEQQPRQLPEQHEEEPGEQPNRFPVDPKRVSAEDGGDDLSAYRGVFRDISPS